MALNVEGLWINMHFSVNFSQFRTTIGISVFIKRSNCKTTVIFTVASIRFIFK